MSEPNSHENPLLIRIEDQIQFGFENFDKYSVEEQETLIHIAVTKFKMSMMPIHLKMAVLHGMIYYFDSQNYYEISDYFFNSREPSKTTGKPWRFPKLKDAIEAAIEFNDVLSAMKSKQYVNHELIERFALKLYDKHTAYIPRITLIIAKHYPGLADTIIMDIIRKLPENSSGYFPIPMVYLTQLCQTASSAKRAYVFKYLFANNRTQEMQDFAAMFPDVQKYTNML